MIRLTSPVKFVVSIAYYHQSRPVGVAALKRESDYAFSTLQKYLSAIHAIVKSRLVLDAAARNTDYASRSVFRRDLASKLI
jgi:hypothetical protein